MVEKKYYSKKEVAEIMGVCDRTIGRYLLSGKLKGARFGKAWKISGEDVQALYDSVKAETAKAIKERNKQGSGDNEK